LTTVIGSWYSISSIALPLQAKLFPGKHFILAAWSLENGHSLSRLVAHAVALVNQSVVVIGLTDANVKYDTGFFVLF
jgi:hypothetical protein